MNAFKSAFIITIKRHFRDATPFIMQVMGPLIMIIILGSAVKGSFSTNISMDPVKVAVVNEDSGQASKQFTGFLGSSTFEKLIKVKAETDINKAKQLLSEGKYGGVIEIKSNFGDEYLKGDYSRIQTYIIKKDKATYQVISSILNGWKNNNAAIGMGLKNGLTINTITTQLSNTGKLILEKPLSNGGKLPKAIDFYSVSMVVMTLVFTGYLALGKLQFDFLSDMKLRFQSSPASIGAILTGSLMGTTFLGFLQSSFIVLFTHFVYGANWGSRWGIVFGTLFLMTFFGQMIASVLALGMKNADAAQGIIGSMAMGFSFLSGGLFISPIGGAIGKFFTTYGTPNSLAQTAIYANIYGGSSQIIYLCMSILAAVSILLLGLTIVFARRRVL